MCNSVAAGARTGEGATFDDTGSSWSLASTMLVVARTADPVDSAYNSNTSSS